MPDALRDVLAKYQATMGAPHGFVRVAESFVLAHDFTAEQGRAWVTEHGGRWEHAAPTERPASLRAGRVVAPPAKPGGVVYLIPTGELASQ